VLDAGTSQHCRGAVFSSGEVGVVVPATTAVTVRERGRLRRGPGRSPGRSAPRQPGRGGNG
jgi:hypothetical protein